MQCLHRSLQRCVFHLRSTTAHSHWRFLSSSRENHLQSEFQAPQHVSKFGVVSRSLWDADKASTRFESFKKMFATVNDVSQHAMDHYDSLPVTLSGIPCQVKDYRPVVIRNFNEVPDLDSRILAALETSNFRYLTPVQKFCIPTAFDGYDIMGKAETGSGKTLAYLLPLLNKLLSSYPESAMNLVSQSRGDTQYPSAVVIVPTRELAFQVHHELRLLSFFTSIKSHVLCGGFSVAQMVRDITEQGLHIAVATPGRLLDLMQQNVVSLRACQFLVLDEADRCLDMGFERDIRKIVESPRFGMPAKEERTTMLYSATFPNEILEMAQDFLKKDHVFVAVGNVELTVPSNIVQEFEDIDDPMSKRQNLLQVIEENPEAKVLVFSQTKMTVDLLDKFLHRNRFRVTSIHGDKTQMNRIRSLDNFKQNKAKILIATDVAARGLDIPNVDLVVNYDCPAEIDQYIHRAGRTGRMGRSGRVVTFISQNGVNATFKKDLMKLLKAANVEVPEFLSSLNNFSSDTHRNSWKSRSFQSGGFQRRDGFGNHASRGYARRGQFDDAFDDDRYGSYKSKRRYSDFDDSGYTSRNRSRGSSWSSSSRNRHYDDDDF